MPTATFLLAMLVLLTSPALVVGQQARGQTYETWIEMLEAVIRAEQRHVRPDIPESWNPRCKDPALPDSLALTTERAPITVGRTTGRLRSHLRVPSGPDTLRVALIGIHCEFRGDYKPENVKLDLYVERDGFYFVIDGYNLATEQYKSFWRRMNEKDWDSFVRVIGPNGVVDRPVYAPRCNMSTYTCSPRLTTVSSFRAGQRAATAAREERIRGKDWPGEFTESAIQRRVMIGMDEEMVREAWGAPQQIHTTQTASIRHEQWVYGSGAYVYFENGRVTAVQTSR